MLAEILGLTAAQVRKDLSVFGGFGKQGTGYEVAPLRQHLIRILNVDAQWPVVVLGAGDLGRALAGNATLRQRGFEIVALFDNDPPRSTARSTNCQSMEWISWDVSCAATPSKSPLWQFPLPKHKPLPICW
jgi:redox-sensing transcriptional repressor